ncbi:rRNA maturation RNase YbeY [Arcticibacterium luteifluviistationis]|uniref:Endoribonuclease YbeY n=1 Tax=Arcticibacterium luteifluviistationis TaxID=1784714 RepID=A0A2Z4G742_9BACT|nr:rRNA maturation RNase YbeY [Arcticibacterium luteifluviistationis]AWV96992.1 rRNA maturation RNase YbeY [Arcticibacterium luteifluviistationis]
MITFQSQDIKFDLKGKLKTKAWLKEVAQKEGFKIQDLNYIFMSDEGLHKINLEYLNHDTYTDIITFDNSEEEGIIESDIFISIDRVKENAESFKTTFDNELRRVLAHGVLHLCGYKDKSDEDAKMMREMEEDSLLSFTH